jgi:hypothetical protein
LSPLTKLFVVLLVVLSLLLTAGTVVFVNATADNKKLLDETKAQLDAAIVDRNNARNEAENARANQAEAVRQYGAQVESSKQMVNSLQQQLVQKDTALAQVSAQQQLLAVENTTLAGALKASEETKSRLQDQVNDLRGSNDKFASQNGQLNLTVTDLTNKLEVTERERKLLAEQLTEAKGQVDKQGTMLRDLGVSPAQLASSVGTRFGAPPINGVIRDIRKIQGVLYAEISVGSSDSVAPGMEFKVVNRDNGAFLGVLTVDSVELNAATGRLAGSRISEIRPGAEVKTQL